jgi:hypothetical protein
MALGKRLQPRRSRDGRIAVSIDTERHMKRQRKHVLEFFQKDPWPVRVGVLAMWFIFLLTLAALMTDKAPRLAIFLKGLL